MRRDSRYFAVGNGLRVLLYTAVVAALWKGPDWGIAAAILILTLHAFLFVVDAFRYWKLVRLIPDPGAVEPAGRAADTASIRLPAKWETEAFYRRLGVGTVRQVVLFYERLAFGENPPEPVTRSSILSFAEECCRAQVVHLLALLMDGIPFVALVSVGSGVSVLLGTMLLAHTGLILLQRYHLVRLRRFLVSRQVRECVS